MPNAMIKFRPNQLVKVEKEDENQVIRRKLRVVSKDTKLSLIKPDNVWERLSKVKRTSSTENGVNVTSKSHLSLGPNVVQQPTYSTLGGGTKKLLPSFNCVGSTNVAVAAGAGVGAGASGCPKRLNNNNLTVVKKPLKKKSPSKKAVLPTITTEVSKMPQSPSSSAIVELKSSMTPPTLKTADSFICLPTVCVNEIFTGRSMSKTSTDDSKYSREESVTSVYRTRSSRYFSQISEKEQSELQLPLSDRSHSPYQSLKSCECSQVLAPALAQNCPYSGMPLVSTRSNNSLSTQTSGGHMINNFVDLLKRNQKPMASDEIVVIRNMLKTSEMRRQLHQGESHLFKDILESQLQEVLKQEMVLKSALSKLEDQHPPSKSKVIRRLAVNEMNSTEDMPAITVIEKSILRSDDTSQHKPKVDVIFKNVPSLEKEIIILKALGEKLEATLKRTQKGGNSDNPLTLPTTSTSILNKGECSSAEHPKVFQSQRLCWEPCRECYKLVEVRPRGLWQALELVQEFRIAHKTIVQLKEDSYRHFYLPVDANKTELKRTNFRQLKQNPDMLLRFLRPKSSSVNFNVLEQDPMFFNNVLFSHTAVTGCSPSCTSVLTAGGKSITNSLDSEEESSCSLKEAGDSPVPHPGRVLILACKENQYQSGDGARPVTKIPKALPKPVAMNAVPAIVEPPPQTEIPAPPAKLAVQRSPKSMKSSEVKHSPPRTRRRSHSCSVSCSPTRSQLSKLAAEPRSRSLRRPRRSRTPMPLHKIIEPKNNLLKTMIVGSVQISVFLILIMAITYPEAKC